MPLGSIYIGFCRHPQKHVSAARQCGKLFRVARRQSSRPRGTAMKTRPKKDESIFERRQAAPVGASMFFFSCFLLLAPFARRSQRQQRGPSSSHVRAETWRAGAPTLGSLVRRLHMLERCSEKITGEMKRI